MSKLLITGATGFLGQYVLKELEEEEFQNKLEIEEVNLLVRNPQKAKDLSSDIYDYKIIEGDLLDHESLRNAVKDMDIVIHIAAVYDNSSPKERFFKANVEGTRAIVESMRPGSTLILTSTYGVYGLDTPSDEKISEDRAMNPYWHYQTSKAQQEEIARSIAKERDIKFVAIRPPTVIGPGEYFFVPTAIENLRTGELVFLRKGGKNIMPFAHAKDVARAHLLALSRIDEVNGESFHLAGFHPTFKEFTDKLAELLGEEPIERNVPYWLAFTMATLSDILPFDLGLNRFSVKYLGSHCELDTSKIKEMLGFEPRYGMNKTLEEIVKWYEETEPESRV